MVARQESQEQITPSLPPTSATSAVSPAPTSASTRSRHSMAPMSPTYDRLEAGRSPPPSARTKPKLFAWKKFALGAGLLLVLVWLFVPKEKRALRWGACVLLVAGWELTTTASREDAV
ncbi:hypothetical protein B0H11DRAFT_2219544 [Mycena galericulata]|nr:hypothetical protein B0H11DRAFT_2219544 [Mycena galericulata]